MNNYLYEKLLTKPYPENQYMDKESITWLENHLNLKISIEKIRNILNKFNKFPIDKLDINKKLYKESNCFGIHGIRHQFRVSLYIWILIQYYNIKLNKNSVIQLLQASLYHDILRVNDNTDLKHGKRSADLIKTIYKKIDNNIINAISNHDNNIEEYTIYDILIKTADALDRYRMPKEKWWIKKEYFLMELDENILEMCKFITLFTEKMTCDIMDIDMLIRELEICLKKIKMI